MSQDIPPFKGGQGRDADDIVSLGTLMFWSFVGLLIWITIFLVA